MKAVLLLQALVAWAVIVCLAVANGLLREAVLVPAIGGTPALVLSGILLSVVVVLVAYGLAVVAHGLPVTQGVVIGCGWLGLTLAFEFGFGRLVQGKSWGELFGAYTFEGGNIWPVVLVVVLFAPALVGWLHSRGGGSAGRR